MVYATLAVDLSCVLFTLGQGEISFCSQRGFSSRVMQFQASAVQVTLLMDFPWFCWKEQSKILILLHSPKP